MLLERSLIIARSCTNTRLAVRQRISRDCYNYRIRLRALTNSVAACRNALNPLTRRRREVAFCVGIVLAYPVIRKGFDVFVEC